MTKVFATPLHLRISGVSVDPELEASVPALLGRKLERYADDVTRVALRFIDGGRDTVCRIELSVKGRDNLVVEARARDVTEAFRKASTLASSALADSSRKSTRKRAPRRKSSPKARAARR